MKLKPCPFCGGEATTSHGEDDYTLGQFFFVSCEYCGSRTRKFHRYCYGEEYERKAIEAWNRRKSLEDIVEQLKDYKTWKEFMTYDLTNRELKIITRAIEIVKSGGKV